MSRVPFFSWSALVASIGLLLVAAGRARRPRSTCSSTTATPGRCSAATSASARGSASPSPSRRRTSSPCRRRARRRARPGDVPQADADARRGLRRPRPRRRRRPVRPSPSRPSSTVPWAGSGLDLDDFGDKFDDLLPYALFTLLPLLGVRRSCSGSAPSPPSPDRQRARPRITAGVPVRLLRPRDGPRRHARRRAARRSPTSACRAPCSRRARSSTSSTAPCSAASARSPTGLPKWTGRTVPDKPALGLALLGVLATVLASLPYYIAGFADQPAASGDVRLRRPVRAVERRRHGRPRPDGARRRWPSSGSWLRSGPRRRRRPATTRGAARRWSG